MAPLTIVLSYAPSKEAQLSRQRKLKRHIRDARAGQPPARITRLQHDDMIDLTGGARDGR